MRLIGRSEGDTSIPMRQTSPSQLIATLRTLVGADRVSESMPDRDAYSRDLWPRAQLDRLVGDLPTRPDCVVWPGSVEEVAAVVKACGSAGVPIVPFGAGSGVCGGARPVHGGVVLDVKRLKTLRRVDAESGLIEVEAGLVGELLERRLATMGLTTGHYPSSILCSTVGGWIAGRSAGQCSSRYGKIEDMVVGLEVVTGDGEIRTVSAADAGGFDWLAVFVGSEGTLGVITAATLIVHPLPEARCFRGWLMPSAEAGLTVMREAMQAGRRPAVLRLYDPLDTLLVGSSGGPKSGPQARLKAMLKEGKGLAIKGWATRLALSAPRPLNALVSTLPGKCLLVTMTEGQAEEAEGDAVFLAATARAAGGEDLGEAPGRAWLAHRYDVSYKQSHLYASGAFVDTFEVATTWARVPALYDAVRRAVAPYCLVMAHFSHAYPGGCSIYFTFAGAGTTASSKRTKYDAAWKAGLDAAFGVGAVIAHHHGVGLSRASHMDAEVGAGRQVFEALKAALDPHGVMNPGKIFGEVGR